MEASFQDDPVQTDDDDHDALMPMTQAPMMMDAASSDKENGIITEASPNGLEDQSISIQTSSIASPPQKGVSKDNATRPIENMNEIMAEGCGEDAAADDDDELLTQESPSKQTAPSIPNTAPPSSGVEGESHNSSLKLSVATASEGGLDESADAVNPNEILNAGASSLEPAPVASDGDFADSNNAVTDVLKTESGTNSSVEPAASGGDFPLHPDESNNVPQTPVADSSEEEGSSSNSDDSSDDESIGTPAIIRRRNFKVDRNQKYLAELGLGEKVVTLASPEKQALESSQGGEPEDEGPTGTLLQHLPLVDEKNEDLAVKYPGRQSQIRCLKAALQVAQLEYEEEAIYVPPPIFVWGPSGTGKTSITQDVVHSLLSSSSSRTGCAYINCATLEPSSIEALVESAYQQIAVTFKSSSSSSSSSSSRKGKSKKRRKKRKRSGMPLEEEEPHDDMPDEGMEDRIEQAREKLSQEEEAEITGKPQEVRSNVMPSLEPDDNDVPDEDMEDRIEQARALRSQEEEQSKNHEPPVEVQSNGRLRYARQSKVDDVKPVKTMALKNTKDVKGTGGVSHGAPLAFGRSLAPFLGIDGEGCAFLVLDHAERLMTMTPQQSRAKSNYLAQLLLLPKVMELRLTVIAISRSTLLMNSRIDNAGPVQKSIGILDIGVHPVRIHFPAYSGDDTFKAILNTPENLTSLIGKGYESDFQKLLVKSFLSGLVQATSGMTRDVNDMISVGRRLWTEYIQPLSASNIEATMKLVQGEDKQKALLSHLNQRMVGLSRNVENSLVGGGTAGTASGLSYLSKCLVLASFICQHNKATKDKQLFTIGANGKRRKQQQQQDDGDPESTAFATWDQQRLKILRPRSFPLERMLSIFVNIVGLHDSKELPVDAKSSFLSSLGNSVFLENLGQLRALGLLREMPRDEGIAMSNAMYYCDMGRDDATSLAESIGFKLDRYLQ